MSDGGSAQPMAISSTAIQQGGAALPVIVVSGQPTIGGPAQPVYVVTSGPVQGGTPMRVSAAASGAVVEGGPAIPVYVVSGSLTPGGVAPVNTVLPVISGLTGLGNTLTTTNGTWTGSPAPTFTYQWNRNGVPIGGATGITYVIQAADLGATLTVTVMATNASGSSSATSAGVFIPLATCDGMHLDFSCTQNGAHVVTIGL